MQRQVEIKIRHGMATGALPIVERNSGHETHARSGPDKTGAAEGETAK